MGQGIMKGKGTAILTDPALAFAKGLAGFKAQACHSQLAHAMAQGVAEKLGTTGVEPLIIEAFITRPDVPQVVELARQIGNAGDVFRGH